ncbi:MAG: N-acetylglucosamine-6-phosphate deacetylase [Alphaproteobacteria bacterium]
MPIFYKNAQIFNGETLLTDYSLVVQDKKIVDILPNTQLPNDTHIIEMDGGILTPGYVETQANGGGGVLFNDEPNVDGIKTILAAHRKYGTVAMLPTLITDSFENMTKAVKAIEDGLKQNIHGLIGGHFEGPFLNLEKKGTHLPQYIRTPTNDDLKLFQSHNIGHSLVTLAPENVPASFIKGLADAGLNISVGHSMASKEDVIRAHNHGLRGLTHFYNAMPALSGREPAIMGSAVALRLFSGIIVDGIHSDPFSLQLAYKALGAERLMLVTDSMHTIGVEGITEFMLTGQKVFVVDDNRLVNEQGSLAGAHITMEQSVKNAVSLMGASITDALKMAIATPATYMQCNHLKTIMNRDIQDILWLDDGLNVTFLADYNQT